MGGRYGITKVATTASLPPAETLWHATQCRRHCDRHESTIVLLSVGQVHLHNQQPYSVAAPRRRRGSRQNTRRGAKQDKLAKNSRHGHSRLRVCSSRNRRKRTMAEVRPRCLSAPVEGNMPTVQRRKHKMSMLLHLRPTPNNLQRLPHSGSHGPLSV